MRTLSLLPALSGLVLLSAAAEAGDLYLDAYTRDFSETTALGGAGAGQTFWPMDATCYNGEATLDLKQITFWAGCNGGGNATTYLAIYDGDPDLGSSSLVGTSTNSGIRDPKYVFRPPSGMG
jgi:hypothetical protein